MNAPFKARDIAEHFLAFANECGSFISNLKLQKLLYYAQAWHLAIYKHPLFPEKFQAWVHGPVIPELYHTYKVFGSKPIEAESVAKLQCDQEIQDFLDELVDEYFDLDAYTLELLTHREDPWKNARNGLSPDAPSSAVISEDEMEAYYRTRLISSSASQHNGES